MFEGKVIGFALTGSFCTLESAIDRMEQLAKNGCKIIPVVSYSVASTDTRFGKASDFIDRIERICKCTALKTIVDVEPIGPKKLLDILVVMPCTGNTMAKLYCGITDTPVTMACKAHLRNGRPLLIAPATNDGLSMNAKNIGGLMNIKNIFFVPFGQDDCHKKPNSITADPDMLIPAIEKALSSECFQPQLI
ncbi:MAG: Dipicolinate synthase subunit B [Firmicutes bacterium ADurb.Bin182]|nr:MAG: Dipicolinate synthase subunit B [Firmicutes bacterium ADurb.Bin182]